MVGRGHNGLRSRLAAGETVFGTMLFEFNSPGVARILASAGADFVLVDMEHTGWSVEGIRPLLTSSRATSTVPIVRAQGSARHLVSGMLDVGAEGVMVPMVSSAAEADQVVQAARFTPYGSRGFGLVHSDQLVGGIDAAMKRIESETIVILQIETQTGLDNLDEIAATPGVDVLWPGLFDLTLSLGVPGQLEHRLVREAADRVVAACEKNGITAGVLAGNLETARSLLDRGFRMIALGSDISLLQGALSEGLAALRKSP
jgi:2-keto-3-deoxy-L-rhamnonate aldolase RhmA